jgi:hypothetical protein
MKLKPKKEIEILLTSDRPVAVLNATDTSVTFRAFFSVDAAAAIEYGLNLCEFKVRTPTFVGVNKQQLSTLNSRNAMLGNTKRKLNALKVANSVVAQGKVDITKQIPNDRIATITGGQPVRKRKVVTLAQVSDDDAVQIKSDAAKLNPTVSAAEDFTTSYSIDTLMRNMKDPASDYNVAPFHAPVAKISRGVRSSGQLSRVNDKTEKFRNSFIENSLRPVGTKLEDEQERVMEVPFTFVVPKSALGKFEVEMDAISKSTSNVADGTRLQTIKFNLDLKKAYQDFIIPTRAPNLQVTTVGSARFLRIKQLDRNSTHIRVYRRVLSIKARDDLSSYEQIAEIPARRGEEVQFTDRPTQAGRCIYRVVPVNEISLSSGEFESVIVPGAKMIERKREIDSLTLHAVEQDSVIVISAYNVPNDVVCLRIVRRNLTTRESEYSTPQTIVGSSIVKVDRSETRTRFEDRASRPDTVYEYKVRMIDAYGDELLSQKSSIIQFCGDARLQSNRSIISQAPAVTVEQEPKVTFQIDAPAEQSTLDKIYSILITNGISEQYATEIKENRELFSKVVAFEVLRFDPITGLNESFGVVKSGVFEDSLRTRTSSNVSRLIAGRRYIYTYRLLIRSPSTLFDSASVDRIDLETGKSFTTKLRKFNSPRALGKGVLSSNVEQVRPISKVGLGFDPVAKGNDELIAGRTSLVGVTEVSVPDFVTDVQRFSVNETFMGNALRWSVIEGAQEIDHVVVYADYNGKRAPLRSLHYCGSNSMVYMDDKLLASADDVSYYLRLVFTDFKQGKLVGPAEIIKDAI